MSSPAAFAQAATAPTTVAALDATVSTPAPSPSTRQSREGPGSEIRPYRWHPVNRPSARCRRSGRCPDGEPWSFPSGHSSGTFANASVLQRHFGWNVGAPASAFATYVAVSRLQANKHFASDVIFGAALGIVSGRAVTVGRGENRLAIAPMGVRGGAGVSFTRVTN